MMEQKNLVPKRRFKEFQNTSAWEQRKLGDLLENAYQGINTAGDKVEYSESGVKILQSKHITSGNITFDDARYLDRDRYSEYLPKYVPNVDDILFANIGTIGPSAVVTEVKEFLIAWNILKMTPKKESNAKFIQLQLQRLNIKRYFESVTTGNATKFVNKDEMLRTQIIVPEKKEQSKIGEFFANLDNLITLHQRKLEKMKALKSAYLSEMFPAEGEPVPKRRFAGFTQAWEQRKLGEMMEVTSVKRIHQSDWTDEGVRFLRARDIVCASKGEEPTDYLYVSQEKYDEYSRISGKVKVGDLLVTGVGTIGVPLLVTQEEPLYFKDGNIIWFKNEKQLDGNFFYYSFIGESIQKYIRDVAGIGTVGTYTIDSGKKTPIQIPSYEEQEKIGNFFKQLDHLITLHQRKLEKLQNIKKAYLNEMFV
ncbi:restriction endonuclease subunit S [Heyndrickxia coagulans]|uniref:restriction endonuclease subunit S n=1 Tax=Heyndrickxia coagulans TaxID=1398 RepID=UPI0035A61455